MKKLLTSIICITLSATVLTACTEQQYGDAEITIPVLETGFEGTVCTGISITV